ncbi:D-alanyl-D-alanine carboxypeptidase family protein [Acetilactobacillus jinshanensis]|uniref:D-alanyl-D-alanine carboxypeptidase n=1 Tax=Acetilactobacillus jinshanensis TaxID=1720083 RepID=A0A4V1ALV3_9LACO|nr:serine hydrolase [Acetilactobacillus jinshanensis]QBP18899.1 D-alanyl-D-alanine carboxypeptidase [Acetilactobacillus jinshanensis]
MKKVTKLALTLMASLGMVAVTSQKPTHASRVYRTQTTRQARPMRQQQVHQTRVTQQRQVKPVKVQNNRKQPRIIKNRRLPRVSRHNTKSVNTQNNQQNNTQDNSTNQNNNDQNQGQQNQSNSLVGTYHLIHGHHYSLPKGKAGVAMDARTGQIVWAKHPNQKRLVASTAKLMTLYLAEQKLAKHPHAWYHKLHISRPLIAMGRNPAFDAFRFKAHKRYSVGDLFKATIIASDDNAAIRLGELVGGTNRNFIKMMNRQARKWHLRATFTSASGLENDDLAPYGYWVKGGYYSGNMVSAKSLAIIAYYLLKDYPSILKYTKINNYTEDGQNLHNANRNLPGQYWNRPNLYVDGLKTGYTPRAGLCLVGTGQKPGKDRLITVLLDDSGEFGEDNDLMNFVYKYSDLYNN